MTEPTSKPAVVDSGIDTTETALAANRVPPDVKVEIVMRHLAAFEQDRLRRLHEAVADRNYRLQSHRRRFAERLLQCPVCSERQADTGSVEIAGVSYWRMRCDRCARVVLIEQEGEEIPTLAEIQAIADERIPTAAIPQRP